MLSAGCQSSTTMMVLRRQGGRRERAFTNAIDQIASRLLAFSRLVASDSMTADDDGARAETGLPAMAPQPLSTGVNGARAAAEHLADHASKHVAASGADRARGEIGSSGTARGDLGRGAARGPGAPAGQEIPTTTETL